MAKLTTIEFIERAIAVHGEKYSYEKSNYVNHRTKIEISCNVHGNFYQFPQNHIRGSGCFECGKELNRKAKCKKNNPIYGVGINDGSRPATDGNGLIRKEYQAWRSMLERCYCKKNNRIKIFSSYQDCIVSENFKSYSYFYDWCQKQVGFGVDGYDLDKDILLSGSKIYSEENCVFIPSQINTLLNNQNKSRGRNAIGVSYHHSKYTASIRIFGKGVYLGRFNNENDAFLAYKKAKENHVKYIANLYKDVIDNRVYNKLVNFSVAIDD